jgi:hypothetical protein
MGQPGGNFMKNISRIVTRGALVAVLGVVAWPALSQALMPIPPHPPVPPVPYHDAPAPIAAAGLPVLAVGYGVYCLIRRRSRKAQ